MAESPVIPIASIWTRRVSSPDPHPVFELDVTLADGSELPLGAYDLFATTFAHISDDGIREALQRREVLSHALVDVEDTRLFTSL
jgi:hypothetical protein